MAKHKPAGGIRSKTVVHKPVRTGAAREHIQKAGVAQLGQMQGDHATNRGSTNNKGVGLIGPNKPISVKLGNEVALNVGKGGVGTGRKQYGQAGSQGCHGAPDPGDPMPKAKALWPGWEK
jgi:hypothetical protein